MPISLKAKEAVLQHLGWMDPCSFYLLRALTQLNQNVVEGGEQSWAWVSQGSQVTLAY